MYIKDPHIVGNTCYCNNIVRMSVFLDSFALQMSYQQTAKNKLKDWIFLKCLSHKVITILQLSVTVSELPAKFLENGDLLHIIMSTLVYQVNISPNNI